MTLYRLSDGEAYPVEKTTFRAEGLFERQDLQKIIRKSIDIVAPNTMVLSEEFGDWEDSRRRIDLLCLDKAARLVVVELKRTEDGGHMDLQAVRYAAMISSMTFDTAVRAHRAYIEANSIEEDAEQRILDFLGWEEPAEEDFATDVAIVLASAEFSKELTTAAIWLSEHDIDIRCVKLLPYKLGEDVLLDVQQIFPLKEAEEYQVRLREKEREERRSRSQNHDITRYRLTVGDTEIVNLPMRGLAFEVIREAIRRGADPVDVCPGKKWLIATGDHTEDSLFSNPTVRDSDSSKRKISGFFTRDDELIKFGGKTYALKKSWKNQALPEIDNIISKFDLNDTSYESMD